MIRSEFSSFARSFGCLNNGVAPGGSFADPALRASLVLKARWLFVLLAALFGGIAAIFLKFQGSAVGFTQGQFLLLSLSFGVYLLYNGCYHHFYSRFQSLKLSAHFQVLIDLLFVTLLVHFTGGAASWFWPIYLVVTLEAAILVERRTEVWRMGAIGGLFYGGLLLAEYFSMVSHVSMPFVNRGIHFNFLHIALMWSWVSLLNATVAYAGAYLMRMIRTENRAVKASEERLMDFLESANDLIFCFASDGRMLYANRVWQRVAGMDFNALSEKTIFDLLPEDERGHCLGEVRKIMRGESVTDFSTVLISAGGELVNLEGSLSGSIDPGGQSMIWAICRDVSENRRSQEQLFHMAHHDSLTGLPNRKLFLDRLHQAMAMARRLKLKSAVLFLDLDRFKLVNDTLGHAFGDRILKEISRRLISCVREADTVARFGGDEFTVVLSNVENKAGVEQVAQKILKELARPMVFEERELFITVSVGISLYPEDGTDAAALIKKADIAMYAAKNEGKNCYHHYSPEMELDAEKRLILETGIRKALENNEFRLEYQPKVDMVTGKITALEALIRWEHPELGYLPPGDFISLAEETGLICPVGEWVLREACRQSLIWQKQGIPPVRVAVNVSGHQLQNKNLLSTVQRILAESGLDPCYLEFEVTETVIMQNPDFVVTVLNEFREIGVHISIDDFGTGYSSLAHLKKFSVNTLKIDRSFVRDVDSNATDAAIATAIIAMGNSLDLKVIAEGVETEGQFAFLKEKLCDEVQGYLISRPLPPEQIGLLLKDGNLEARSKCQGGQGGVAPQLAQQNEEHEGQSGDAKEAPQQT